MFTIYSADVTGNASNCLYPHRFVVLEKTTLKEAVSHDYVCAEYLGGRRSNSSFIGSDCLPVDCDNDHTDDPAGWVTPEDVMAAFPGVGFGVHFSRNNMREKNGKAPRPKFHILFPIARVTDAEQYSRMKKAVCTVFPRIDVNALDAARFFYGTEDAEVDYWPGERDLTEFLAEAGFSCEDPGRSGGPAPEAPASPAPDPVEKSYGREIIPQGRRNSTLSRFAGSVLKKYGVCKEAREAFDNVSALCEPPLDGRELDAIWQSAVNFYNRISAEDGYIEPEIYNLTPRYMPADFTDAGQAEMLKLHYCGRLRYSPATGFICYNGRYWEESETKAQAIALELTELQLREASGLEVKALEVLRQNGADNVLMDIQSSKLGRHLTDEQKKTYTEFNVALQYQKFVLRCRNAGGIESVLAASRHLMEIDPDELDADCFALNTPAGVYDLRKGLEGLRPHDPEDLITKITAVSPGMEGIELWNECLDTIFCGDDELTRYVQLICGLAAIGKVFVESLIIAYGAGRNGKSTFWNTVSRVLGKYSGNISADTLTVGCRRNVKPELAETKGKRLLIAAEMQEGARLNDSTVKQLCSTDDIFAEKKYKAPFSFRPCHTLVLYTNHLPRVSGSDEGTWRRLTVIPFGAKIEGSSDIKNYADYLFENAGGAILSWIIEGARQVIEMDYRIPVPGCVREAIDEYRSSNDWFAHFVEDRCETGETCSESSAALYQAYRNYCLDMNEYVRSTTDFYAELEKRGFEKIVISRVKRIKGLRIRQFRGSEPDLF